MDFLGSSCNCDSVSHMHVEHYPLYDTKFLTSYFVHIILTEQRFCLYNQSVKKENLHCSHPLGR